MSMRNRTGATQKPDKPLDTAITIYGYLKARAAEANDAIASGPVPFMACRASNTR
jgi:hypothetical protein